MQPETWQGFPPYLGRTVLGEYDVHATKPAIVDLDLNLDYTFDGADLGMLLGRWGEPYDGADLALILANWGNKWHRHDQAEGRFAGRYYIVSPSLEPVIVSDPNNPSLSYMGWGPSSTSRTFLYEALSPAEFPAWADHARGTMEYIERVSVYIVHDKSLDAAEGIVAWQQSPQQSSGTEASTTLPSESPLSPPQSTSTMSSLSLVALACFLLCLRPERARS